MKCFFYTLLTKDTLKFSLNFGKDLVVVLFQLSCLFFCLVGNIVLIHFLLMGLKLEASVFLFVGKFCCCCCLFFCKQQQIVQVLFLRVMYCKNGYKHLNVFSNIWIIFVNLQPVLQLYLDFSFTAIFALP